MFPICLSPLGGGVLNENTRRSLTFCFVLLFFKATLCSLSLPRLPSRLHQKYSKLRSAGAYEIRHNVAFLGCGLNAIYCCSTLFKRPDFSERRAAAAAAGRQAGRFFYFILFFFCCTESRLQPTTRHHLTAKDSSL